MLEKETLIKHMGTAQQHILKAFQVGVYSKDTWEDV